MIHFGQKAPLMGGLAFLRALAFLGPDRFTTRQGLGMLVAQRHSCALVLRSFSTSLSYRLRSAAISFCACANSARKASQV